MPVRQALLLSCLSAVVLLPSARQKIFMQESDASSFLQRRGKRSPKLRDEVNVENWQKLRADELRREYYEEQRKALENFAKEQKDEQEERSQEAVEQWRQWHYHGLFPSYLYDRGHI